MQKTSATLLIIDDDEVVRASLAAYLEDSGFSVLQASNGQQGLQVFERDQPDLVICDLRMPQMGGLELIRQVTELAPQTPVIVVSGAGVMNDAVEALRLGAADYLIKPLEDLAVLEHSVRRALDRARLLVENQRYREKLETANRELEASLNLLQEDQNAGRQVQMNMLPVSPWSIWVAIPAWSVPGCHRVLRPCMRRKRINASMIALLKPWPMCRLPVTFGGGIMMV